MSGSTRQGHPVDAVGLYLPPQIRCGPVRTAGPARFTLNTSCRMPSKPKSIDQYILAAEPGARKHLRELLACLRKAAPGAEENIKWGMPSMSYQRILFQFAAYKRHIGFYPTPAAVRAFAAELEDFKTGKGSIQFPLASPLPVSLIRRIADFRVREVRENDAKWM